MSKTVYQVREVGGFNDTRVFAVEFPMLSEQFKGKTDETDVWVSGGSVSCVMCSGPLTAMLSSCPHAKAVKRHLAKEAAG